MRTELLIPWLASAMLSAAEPHADPAQTMLIHLRAAGEARAARAWEDSRWAEERQRLEIATKEQLRIGTALAEERRTLEETIAGQRQALAEPETEVDSVASLLASGAQRIAARWQVIADAAMPGLVELPTEIPESEEGRFAALVETVQRAERSNTQVALLNLEGTLEGSTRVVRALRVGGACAWWVTLDGTRAGTVRREQGMVHLDADSDPRVRETIVTAMEVADGRRASAVIRLPRPGLSESGGQP